MKIKEVEKPKFVVGTRKHEGKFLIVYLKPEEWDTIEEELGRYLCTDELKAILLGLFSGRYTLRKR